MKITSDDLAWVAERFPELSYELRNGLHRFEGLLCFSTIFDRDGQLYFHNAGECEAGLTITDSYRVCIEVPEQGEPTIREIAGRIPETPDRHKYFMSNKVCAWGPLDTPGDNASLRDLFSLAVQYFYDQSYFERYGEWPRGEYGHGVLGLLQNYQAAHLRGENRDADCLGMLKDVVTGIEVRDRILGRRDVKGHHDCLCGSGLPYRKCHPELLQAIWRLRRYSIHGRAE